MRIVHGLAYYGNYFGGIQHSVNQVSRRQFSAGHEVKIITSDMFDKSDIIDNVPVKRLKTLFTVFRVPLMPTLFFALLEEDCDVLHVYLPLPSLDVCAMLKKKLHARTKLVVSIRNLLSNPTTWVARVAGNIHDKGTIRMAIESADAIVFTTKEFPLSLPYEIPKEKMFVVPNGIDTDLFHPEPDYSFNPDQILFVGRLIPEKGLHILMRAVRIVQKEFPNIRLVAVGPDYYNQKEYRSKVLALDNDFLELHARASPRELARLYRNSAVFVLPSIGLESFGNVLMEAMASGCPVICTDLPGPNALVRSGSSFEVGSVVPKGNVEELSLAIMNELRNNNRTRRKKIREFAKSRASWDSVTRQLISIYKRC